MEKHKKHTASGMKIPDGYFDTFYRRLSEHLPSGTPELSHGFSIPEGYFEKSKIAIYSATIKQKPKKSALRVVLPWVAAAMIVIAFSSVWFLTPTSSEEITLNQQDINNYINNNFNETDFYWISQEISAEAIDNLALPPIENPEIIGQYLSEYAYMENTEF